MRIFISGPYSNDDPAIVQANVARAIDAGRRLIERGHNPYIPHLSHYILEGTGCLPRWQYRPAQTAEMWYDIDLRWLESCDSIFMLDNWQSSVGARKELDHADNLGLPVFYENYLPVPNAATLSPERRGL